MVHNDYDDQSPSVKLLVPISVFTILSECSLKCDSTRVPYLFLSLPCFPFVETKMTIGTLSDSFTS